MAFKSFLSICAGVIMLAQSAAAVTTYSFFWTGDPIDDPNILASADASFQAIGTFNIEGSAGEAVTLADVVSASIAVTGATITDFLTSDLDTFSGVISDDGSSISLTSLFFNRNDVLPFFGCTLGDCSVPQIRVDDSGTNLNLVDYDTQDNALSALRLDVVEGTEIVAVPLPAGVFLTLTALGTLVLLRRRRI